MESVRRSGALSGTAAGAASGTPQAPSNSLPPPDLESWFALVAIGDLNAFMRLGPAARRGLRTWLSSALAEGSPLGPAPVAANGGHDSAGFHRNATPAPAAKAPASDSPWEKSACIVCAPVPRWQWS